MKKKEREEKKQEKYSAELERKSKAKLVMESQVDLAKREFELRQSQKEDVLLMTRRGMEPVEEQKGRTLSQDIAWYKECLKRIEKQFPNAPVDEDSDTEEENSDQEEDSFEEAEMVEQSQEEKRLGESTMKLILREVLEVDSDGQINPKNESKLCQLQPSTGLSPAAANMYAQLSMIILEKYVRKDGLVQDLIVQGVEKMTDEEYLSLHTALALGPFSAALNWNYYDLVIPEVGGYPSNLSLTNWELKGVKDEYKRCFSLWPHDTIIGQFPKLECQNLPIYVLSQAKINKLEVRLPLLGEWMERKNISSVSTVKEKVTFVLKELLLSPKVVIEVEDEDYIPMLQDLKQCADEVETIQNRYFFFDEAGSQIGDRVLTEIEGEATVLDLTEYDLYWINDRWQGRFLEIRGWIGNIFQKNASKMVVRNKMTSYWKQCRSASESGKKCLNCEGENDQYERGRSSCSVCSATFIRLTGKNGNDHPISGQSMSIQDKTSTHKRISHAQNGYTYEDTILQITVSDHPDTQASTTEDINVNDEYDDDENEKELTLDEKRRLIAECFCYSIDHPEVEKMMNSFDG